MPEAEENPRETAPKLGELLRKRRRTALVRAARRCLLGAGAAQDAIVIGCSGGPDSTALLLALWALHEPLSLRLSVVSIDHGLRPESQAESAAVCALAERLGLAAVAISVKVPHGPSKMALARTARYAALADAARRVNARWVAMAHHREDQSESMLIRWLGGAGLTGLSGMAPVAPLPESLAPPPLFVLRPLLTVPRAEIDAFLAPLLAQLAPLPFFDPSNASLDYLRTRIRSQGLPALRQIAPHLDAHLLALSRQLRADAEYLDDAARKALATLDVERQEGTLSFDIAALLQKPQALLARLLRLAVHEHLGIALGQRHVEALLGLCQNRAGKKALDLPGRLRAERHRLTLRLIRSQAAIS